MNQTVCGLCGRLVGATRSFNNRDGDTPEWKTARHSITDPTPSKHRRPICRGSGMVIPPVIVFPTKERVP
jgi:hypothetical protein